VELKHRRKWRSFLPQPRRFRRVLQKPRKHRRYQGLPKVGVADGDAGLYRGKPRAICALSTAPAKRCWAKWPMEACLRRKYVAKQAQFFPMSWRPCVFGNGRDACTAFINIAPEQRVGSWRGAQQHWLCVLSRTWPRHPPSNGHDPRDPCGTRSTPLSRADEMLSGLSVHRFVVPAQRALIADDGDVDAHAQSAGRKVIGGEVRRHHRPHFTTAVAFGQHGHRS